MSSTVQFIGIDVGCTSLSAAVEGCKPRDFPHTQPGPVVSAARCCALCAAFAAERLKLEQAMAELFAAEPQLAQRRALLLSIRGIGPQTATALLARADILLTRSAKQLTAYAGLVPQQRPQQHRPRWRRPAAYAALPRRALRQPPRSRVARLQRPRASGKHGKAALIAVARKLLLIAQAVLKTGKPFEPSPQP